MNKTRSETQQHSAYQHCHKAVLLDVFIPPREAVDTLMKCYLDTFEYTHRILHVPTFKESFARFWTVPLQDNEPFYAKLLLVMAIGSFHGDAADIQLARDMAPQGLISTWLHAAQHWLDFAMMDSKISFDAVQVHALLLLARQVNSEHANLIWISSGSLVRTALVMGLNRDPDSFSSMTPYHAEMRRRLWATIVEIDLQSSLDAGKPLAISFDDCNCRSPSNLDDEDISETDTILATPKPAHIFTRTSFQVAMHTSLDARIEIVRLANSCHFDIPYQKVLTAAAPMARASQNSPLSLRPGRMTGPQVSNSVDFPAAVFDLIVRRYLLALHRPVSVMGAYEPTYHLSRITCFDSSLKILSLLGLESSSPSGTTNRPSDVVRHCGGMFRNDLYHAALTICLELLMGLVDFERLGCSIHGLDICIAPGTAGRLNFDRFVSLVENFLLVTESWNMSECDYHKMHIFLSMAISSVKARSSHGNPRDAVLASTRVSIRICKGLLLATRRQEGPDLATMVSFHVQFESSISLIRQN